MSSSKKSSTPVANKTKIALSAAVAQEVDEANIKDVEWVNREWIVEGEIENDVVDDEELEGEGAGTGVDDNDGESSSSSGIAPRYFDWKVYYPFLDVLFKNKDVITEEMKSLTSNWTPWPEYNLYNAKDQAGDWTVVPFVHTFPATDPSKTQWISINCEKCPRTYEILKSIPNLRTALFSRLGPLTRISSHQGWADLANHVLRCHFPLIMPKKRMSCGMWVDGVVKYHNADNILVFDDSRMHKAFNASEEERIIMIIDIMRPESIPLGRAKGGHTDDLDKFIDEYNRSLGLAPAKKGNAGANGNDLKHSDGNASDQKQSSSKSSETSESASGKTQSSSLSPKKPTNSSPSKAQSSSSKATEANKTNTPSSSSGNGKGKSPQKGSGNNKKRT